LRVTANCVASLGNRSPEVGKYSFYEVFASDDDIAGVAGVSGAGDPAFIPQFLAAMPQMMV
jgi:hypothetical protein